MSTLQNLGERQIIRRLQRFITNREKKFTTNEDAYFHQLNSNLMVVNIDSMSKNTDFLPHQTWYQLGEKLVAITISDLAAKGAVPEIFLSSLILEPDMPSDDLEELAKGIQQATRKYSCLYLGGDLGSSRETVLVGCCIGHAIEGKFIGRNSAKPGDIVCVTGTFGLSGIGLQLEVGKKTLENIEIPEYLRFKALERIHIPRARVKEGKLLNRSDLATASIDSSDGLAVSLHWLSELSGVKILVDNLPIDPLLKDTPVSEQLLEQWTLYGGEEYELVFTVRMSDISSLGTIFSENNCSFQVIGRCVTGSGVYRAQERKLKEINFKGWDSFNISK
ncbi:MAG: thiamine-phosphate kinase [Candidatus Hodarchaeales archaeon]|jgi:thiamine-monophosphate kinase